MSRPDPLESEHFLELLHEALAAAPTKNLETFLKALESGDYPQARGNLCVETPGGQQCFCAQGLALQTIRLNTHWGLSWKYYPEAEDAPTKYLWFTDGLTNTGGYITGNENYVEGFYGPETAGFWDMVCALNDSYEMTFKEIAQFIREQLEQHHGDDQPSS